MLVYLTTGIHIQQSTICNLLNLPVPKNEPKFKVAAIKFLTAKPNICEFIDGVNEAMTKTGVYEVDVNIKPGDVIKPLLSSLERLGYVIASGESVDEAWDNALDAASSITIR